MTLATYDAQRLDDLSLRVLDICVHLRNMARTARREQLSGVDLHDRKALEWIEKLDSWAIAAEAELHALAMQAYGARTAKAVLKKSRKSR